MRRPTWAELQAVLCRAAEAARHLEFYANESPETGNWIIAQREANRAASEARRLMRLATMTDAELREVPEE